MTVAVSQPEISLSRHRRLQECSGFDLFLDLLILCLYCSYQFFSKGNMVGAGEAISVFTILMILLKLFLIVYKNKFNDILSEFNVRAIAPILVLCILFYFGQNRFDLFVAYGLCIALCDLPVQKISDYLGSIFAIFYALHLILYRMGYIREFTDNMPRLTEQGMTYRLALGFDQPNFNTCFILPILAAALVSDNKKKRYLFLAITLCYTFISYRYTDSRTSLIAVVCGVVIWLFSKSFDKYVKHMDYVVIAMIATFVFTTYYVSLKYCGNEKINFVLSQRPAIMRSIQNNGLNLFYNSNLKAEFFTGASIDNFYFMLIYGYGLLVAVGIFYLIIKTAKVAEMHHNKKITLVIVLYLIYGLTENHVLDFGFSYLSLFLFLPFVRPSSFDRKLT